MQFEDGRLSILTERSIIPVRIFSRDTKKALDPNFWKKILAPKGQGRKIFIEIARISESDCVYLYVTKSKISLVTISENQISNEVRHLGQAANGARLSKEDCLDFLHRMIHLSPQRAATISSQIQGVFKCIKPLATLAGKKSLRDEFDLVRAGMMKLMSETAALLTDALLKTASDDEFRVQAETLILWQKWEVCFQGDLTFSERDSKEVLARLWHDLVGVLASKGVATTRKFFVIQHAIEFGQDTDLDMEELCQLYQQRWVLLQQMPYTYFLSGRELFKYLSQKRRLPNDVTLAGFRNEFIEQTMAGVINAICDYDRRCGEAPRFSQVVLQQCQKSWMSPVLSTVVNTLSEQLPYVDDADEAVGYAAFCSIVTKFEAILRELHHVFGVHTLRLNKIQNDKLVIQERTDILTEEYSKDTLGYLCPGDLHLFQFFLTKSQGFNLRTRVAHGRLPFEEYRDNRQIYNSLALLLLVRLSKYTPSDIPDVMCPAPTEIPGYIDNVEQMNNPDTRQVLRGWDEYTLVMMLIAKLPGNIEPGGDMRCLDDVVQRHFAQNPDQVVTLFKNVVQLVQKHRIPRQQEKRILEILFQHCDQVPVGLHQQFADLLYQLTRHTHTPNGENLVGGEHTLFLLDLGQRVAPAAYPWGAFKQFHLEFIARMPYLGEDIPEQTRALATMGFVARIFDHAHKTSNFALCDKYVPLYLDARRKGGLDSTILRGTRDQQAVFSNRCRSSVDKWLALNPKQFVLALASHSLFPVPIGDDVVESSYNHFLMQLMFTERSGIFFDSNGHVGGFYETQEQSCQYIRANIWQLQFAMERAPFLKTLFEDALAQGTFRKESYIERLAAWLPDESEVMPVISRMLGVLEEHWQSPVHMRMILSSLTFVVEAFMSELMGFDGEPMMTDILSSQRYKDVISSNPALFFLTNYLFGDFDGANLRSKMAHTFGPEDTLQYPECYVYQLLTVFLQLAHEWKKYHGNVPMLAVLPPVPKYPNVNCVIEKWYSAQFHQQLLGEEVNKLAGRSEVAGIPILGEFRCWHGKEFVFSDRSPLPQRSLAITSGDICIAALDPTGALSGWIQVDPSDATPLRPIAYFLRYSRNSMVPVTWEVFVDVFVRGRYEAFRSGYEQSRNIVHR